MLRAPRQLALDKFFLFQERTKRTKKSFTTSSVHLQKQELQFLSFIFFGGLFA
ncbi:hypothetical protein H6P81_005669 [Aristolochia fimbriata]|uniref:Uncharacterized protein n=1 Tax=Aristolochia fimbriata TaxID=158543 RepID=A0AAV7EV46_ARIFI|nr:hypothetical protein H6P81_005669 [Aristolochia fimbriata]